MLHERQYDSFVGRTCGQLLNSVEKDFVEFLAERRGRAREEFENVFLETRRRFRFDSLRYRELMVDIHDLHRLVYDDSDERELIDSYQFHELIHLFRFISYSYPKSPWRYWDGLAAGIRLLARGEFGKIAHGFRKAFAKTAHRKDDYATMDHPAMAAFLMEQVEGDPAVVDYGCGLAYTAFEIGRIAERTKVYLVDVDCLTLEFAAWRFRKHGIDVEAIPVTKDSLYPSLPAHSICIASEVMEHVARPLTVYEHIVESMTAGGILCGSFGDHHREMFHISPNLSELRRRIAGDFEPIGHSCHRKK